MSEYKSQKTNFVAVFATLHILVNVFCFLGINGTSSEKFASISGTFEYFLPDTRSRVFTVDRMTDTDRRTSFILVNRTLLCAVGFEGGD